ncbi:PREDICTED: uncharacterized protein LOC105456537 [Wasmannia auropunctata]|uniref:uncharacterized protein LOC105456537 n=1 Tax=Wasmannia auropunctata TaxID=64793 RepID=UPI0005EE127F|nr:PREDICTED: uncharacterized protein LOC105456537 [Wasmannia auropunctata]
MHREDRFYDCCVSNMAFNDLWKVTIVPSQVTSSNDTITSSTKTLSTITERESNRDFCLSFDENEGKKDTYGNAEMSKIISLSPTYQKLNCDYSHRSFKSGKPLTSVLHENEKESHDRVKDKINNKEAGSPMRKDTINAPDALFIELETVYKILDFIADSDPKVSSLTNNCCNEISRTLQCLLAQRRDKKLENLLLNDSSLRRCERCGVISYMLESRSAIEKLKKSRTKPRYNSETITAERDCSNNDQTNEQSEILISAPDLINNVRSKIKGINDSKENQIEYKDKLSEMKLLPIEERAFVMKGCIENSKESDNISVTRADISATINNTFYQDNKAIKKLFTNLETEENKRYKCKAARSKYSKHDSSNVIKAYASSIDREEIIREILYEPKSQIDDLLARDRCSNIARKIHQASQRPLDDIYKHGDIYPVVDTVKYLARGQFTELDEKEDELLSKLQERRCTRLNDTRNERSSVLYGSREDCLQRADAGFWLFDESGRLPRVASNEYRYPLEIDNDRENVSFPSNISRHFHAVTKMKTDRRSSYMEKDSLENCASSEQRRGSNATTFSSSSIENLILGSLRRKHEMNNIDKDISRGRKLVSSRPSLDIARHVRAQIAKDRLSGNAEESMSELCTHDSNVLARLSSETRRGIRRLIKTIVTSNKNSTFYYKKYLTSDTLNSGKLLHSRSADATFARSNKCYKTDNETNIFADDCIPTKLSELRKGRPLGRQDSFVNMRSQDQNKSKDSVKDFHENVTSVSSDKSTDNSTKRITRRIIYKDAPLKNIIGNNDEHVVAEFLPIYRKILKNSEDMDWENFREFVEVLHPREKELWRDICRTIGEEVRRTSGDADVNTEIYIEISPVNPEEISKTKKVMTCAREIVFELNMTLKDVEDFQQKTR